MYSWKAVAVDKLKEYAVRRRALETLPLEIERTQLEQAHAKEIGDKNAELRAMANLGELSYRLEDTRLWVKGMDKAAKALNAQERRLLTDFYITPKVNAAQSFSAEMEIDVKEVYALRQQALKRFTLALYGITESV